MIQIENLSKVYDNGFEVIKDLTVTINKGDVISVIGPSGTGKSTFIRCINRLEEASSGRIIFDGLDLNDPSTDIDLVRRRMGMIFQNFSLFEQMSVLDNLTIGQIRLLKRSRKDAVERAKELLETVGLANKINSFPEELSGGQKQRVAIARTLSMDPEIILLDEPTSALDPTMVGEITAVTRNLAKQGMTMIIVTHEMNFARNVSNRIFYMDEKGIYEDGTPEDIFENPKKPRTKEFIFHIKSFNYTLDDEHYDYIELNNEYINFAFKNGVNEKNTNSGRLIIEELATIVPKSPQTTITFSAAGESNAFELICVYPAEERNILSDDNLSAMIVKNATKTQEYEYTDGLNRLTLKW
jgi:polar amino acid transport system ATP-binding protein